MAAVRRQIKHVIYIVKENRTYDQVFGDLPRGNGDPSLAILSPFSPNHKKLAMDFVLLDNFHDSGTVSGDGWNWSTAGRANDYTQKTVPVNYAGRGFSYDWEGANRNVNVVAARAGRAHRPRTPRTRTIRTCCRASATSPLRTAPKAKPAPGTSGTPRFAPV